MPRFLRRVPAGILAVLLLVCGIDVVRDVGAEQSAWGAISVVDAPTSLHSSNSTPRVDIRQQRRNVVLALLSPTPSYRVGTALVAGGTPPDVRTPGLDASTRARGYDATAPPHALS